MATKPPAVGIAGERQPHGSRSRIVTMSRLPALMIVLGGAVFAPTVRWTEEQVATIRSLSLDALEPLPSDPSNRYAEDSTAASFGRSLFFDARLSVNGAVSCATCHPPDRQFQDGLPLGRGVGVTSRRTMPIAGTAYSPWFFWDGRKDSQWAQALGPLESGVEHGGNRALYARAIVEFYAEEYARIFGPLPDLAGLPANAGPVDDPIARAAWDALSGEDREAVTRVFVNMGKAIAAYERTLAPGRSRFDRYADAIGADGRGPSGILTPDEEAGLRLFIGKGNCTQCHDGPRFTDDHFHNIGVPDAPSSSPDVGRAEGARTVLEDEFNCRSRYSDANANQCPELDFLVAEGDELVGAFKTPSLRGVAARAPYMHSGQITTLEEAIEHYDRAPRARVGSTELEPLHLSAKERAQLNAYLRTLDGTVSSSAPWLPISASRP